MKKLYFLDEEEKNRILNLHESATKRQYLSEQPLGPVKTPEVGPKREGVTRDANWNGIYACVKKTKGAVASTLSDKSTAYILNGYVYYNNGMKRKQPVKSNKSEKYTCNDPEFKSGVATEDKAKKIQQYRQQIITKTSDTTKQIQALLGLEETGKMDTGLLQKINDKLNGKPQEAPKADVTTQARPKVEPLQQLTPAGVETQQLTTQNPEQLAAGLQQMQQKDAEAAKTPLTNKEKRQERRDLRKANRAEMQALRDKQRGNQ
jgi:hypothetical protein